MSKEKKEDNNLPAYTTADNIILLLDAYKIKNGKEDEAKMIFGKGNSRYSNTKSALRIFELINEDDCNLTNLGRKIAYSNEDEKKVEIITNFWGRFGQGSS